MGRSRVIRARWIHPFAAYEVVDTYNLVAVASAS
jgi:hypothetical protein